MQTSVAQGWLARFSMDELYEEVGGEWKYLGEASGEAQTLVAMQRAKATSDPVEMVLAVEDVVLNFCGFQGIKTKFIANALHFQFGTDVDRLVDTTLTALTDAEGPSDSDKALFDDTQIVSAELLLRVVVETADGELVANPFSPGQPMGKLLKLPLFAQLVLVLTNAVEATLYQEELPDCPMAINVYASLLVEGAPVRQMVEGVQHVEIMEMTKGAKRGPEVVQCVQIMRRDLGCEVLLDDFECSHPGLDSEADGIKASVFINAFHTLQVFKEGSAEMKSMMLKEELNDKDFRDFYSLVAKAQPRVRRLILEGSENCLKSEVTPGPPLNFGEPNATIASAHLCLAIAIFLRMLNPEIKMCRQGGRALYSDEDFDAEASIVIAKCGVKMPAARTNQAGTMAWMGQEAVRRAGMKTRPLVCGIAKINVAAP
jgi:hypothetical protein